jgi:LAS superfamily LD-carboxypeptidase LdcB
MNYRAAMVFIMVAISVSYLIATKILKPNLQPIGGHSTSTTFGGKNSKNDKSNGSIDLKEVWNITAISFKKSIDPTINKSFVMGRFLPKNDRRFQMVPGELCSKPMYLQKEVVVAFQQMKQAADSEGVSLRIISGTRNFWEQKAIWERKWNSNLPQFGASVKNAREILKYSSMPSSSRHHWGTDIDINNLNPSYFHSGKGLKEIQWLRKNASKYGFIEVYSARETGRLSGYEPEAWHWSYAPLSSQYLEYYKQNVQYSDFQGFLGCEWAKDLRIIEDFVGGVSK